MNDEHSMQAVKSFCIFTLGTFGGTNLAMFLPSINPTIGAAIISGVIALTLGVLNIALKRRDNQDNSGLLRIIDMQQAEILELKKKISGDKKDETNSN